MSRFSGWTSQDVTRLELKAKEKTYQRNLFPKQLSEKEVQKQVISLLLLNGWLAVRINSGSFVQDSKRFIRTYIIANNGKSAGFPDVLAMKGNEFLLLEIKKGKGGKLSVSQKEFYELLNRKNIQHYVISDVEQLEAILNPKYK